jgi:hypothetical protein
MILGTIMALGIWLIVLLFIAACMFKIVKKLFKWMVK